MTDFIQRELSWMDFNERVLHCAFRKNMPLNESLKFLAITGSNLDEFISVRFASLLDDGDSKTIEEVLSRIHEFLNNQAETFKTLISAVADKGMVLTPVNKLPKSSKEKVKKLFDEDIFPCLTPSKLDNSNEIPNLISGISYIVVTIKEDNEEIMNIIPINANIKSEYIIDGKLVFIEDIVNNYVRKLFVKKDIISVSHFRVIKDANIILNHDQNKFILDRMNDTLIKRQFSKPIFMEVSDSMPKKIRNALANVFDLPKQQVHVGSMDYTRFMSSLLDRSFSYAEFSPAVYEATGDRFSLFSELNEHDILLHHPYDSYNTVVKFIEHAASDDEVLAIKMTLYRVSSPESPIVNALMRAAENGKQVSVLVEIKARFNESMNIRLVNKLKMAGVNVILGEEFLKTHCKFCIVVRKENDGVKIYSHIATGNYNEKTAKIYTDLSFLTSKQKIGYDLVNVFNILSGLSDPDEKLQKVFYAPVNLRSKLCKLIDREIEFAKKGKKASIFIKVNSISDDRMVKKLYEAADKGVSITIICRGVCSIVPRKNLRIKSIVGRFLEHSRIYCFGNKNRADWFISSADLLTRNLDKRVEILLSLTESTVIAKIDQISQALIRDEANSYLMKDDGDFMPPEKGFDSHQWFIDNAESTSVIKLPKKKK